MFPKYYLTFHSEFPLYYSLRVDPLFHKILLTVSQMTKTNEPERYMSYTKILKRLKLQLTVSRLDGRPSSRVSRHVALRYRVRVNRANHLHLHDSVKFC